MDVDVSVVTTQVYDKKKKVDDHAARPAEVIVVVGSLTDSVCGCSSSFQVINHKPTDHSSIIVQCNQTTLRIKYHWTLCFRLVSTSTHFLSPQNYLDSLVRSASRCLCIQGMSLDSVPHLLLHPAPAPTHHQIQRLTWSGPCPPVLLHLQVL